MDIDKTRATLLAATLAHSHETRSLKLLIALASMGRTRF